MGTENRRPADLYIPPSDVPYEFIIFRASEVKDIAVDHAMERQVSESRSIHDDPAIMTVTFYAVHDENEDSIINI
jgi:protein LSM14